ncbi:MAG: MFS transporter [Bacteroidaceae bacterium]|nr:MFS transporter [Bacteroidaceae bacterium]
MTEKIKATLRDSKAARWTALVIVSFTMMMAYFFTDVMGPLEAPLTTKGKLVYFEDGSYLSADSLMKITTLTSEDEIAVGDTYIAVYFNDEGETESKELTVSSTINGLGWSNSDYGIFSGAYGYINVFLFMLFFGGLILDKMGVRFTGIMSTGLMFVGAAIKWYAVDNGFAGELFGLPTQVVVACLGFAIYGMGAEIAGITVTKVIAKWFAGHEMALAMGLQVALARVGTACALFFALPIAQSIGSVSAPVMFGASALCIGLLSYIVYCVMDKKLDKSIAEEDIAAESEEQFKFSDLKLIFCNQGFWLITFLCLIFYAAVFPFLKFATNLMIIKYGVSPSIAGMIPGLLPFGTMLLTPLFGSLYDKMGKGATLMIIGSVLLTIVHLLFAMPLLNVWWFAVIIMILLGIAFSLVPSAMWPSVPKIIPMKQLGSAYAIIFYIQNIGLSMVPVLIGNAIAANTSNGTTDYTVPMLIFALFGAMAVVIAVLLKITDKRKGYGLEEANIK